MIRQERLNETVKVVNKQTGEIREAELVKVYTITDSDKDKFYQMYSNGVTAILGLKPEYCGLVFMWLSANQNNNKIVVNKITREEIAKSCKLSEVSVYRALKVLTDNGVINKLVKGYYEINPWYAWSGTKNDRDAILDKARISVRIDILPNEEVYRIEE